MSLDIQELDFDLIVGNIIDFLETKPEFTDYDFTGSSLNVLIQAYAYAVHYMGMQAHMNLTEAFLDSAQLRNSVVSKAKELGYFPGQSTGAQTSFTIALDASAEVTPPTSFVIPAQTVFIGTGEDNKVFHFVTTSPHTLTDDGTGNDRLVGTVSVVEGTYKTKEWTVTSDPKLRYIIPDLNVSKDNIKVTVKPNEASTDKTVWSYVKSILDVGPTTEVFFLTESFNGKLEIFFGNDKLGKALTLNNYVIAEYIQNNGSKGNGISNIQLNESITGTVNTGGTLTFTSGKFTLTNIETTHDGVDQETISSIKHVAPLDYQSQERVVTLSDYKTRVLANYKNILAINAWGGEEADPPQYGKVFVSIIPKTGTYISPATKVSIETDVLKKYNVVGIIPEIVDPEFIRIDLDVIVNYNKDLTTLIESQLETVVYDTITGFFVDNIYDFNSTFKYSKLVTSIDGSDNSIISNLVDVKLSKPFVPATGGQKTYELKFNNAFEEESLISESWLTTGNTYFNLKDDGAGNIDLYSDGLIFKKGVGNVDYSTGVIDMVNFDTQAQSENQNVYISVNPVSNNIETVHNNLLVLGVTDISMVSTT